MNRTEWKAFSHSIRKDARDFREQHGGYPCFTRHLVHNDQEWSITHRMDSPRSWSTNLRKTLIRQRAWQGLSAACLNECRQYRADHRNPCKGKRMARQAIRSAIQEARETREGAGWHRLRTTIDRSSRYAA